MNRLALFVAVMITLPAHAQTYPSRPIKMITQFSAGSGGDNLTRVVSAAMQEVMGQPVVIENRAGAGGVQAAEAIARSASDGYTIGALTPGVVIVRVVAGTKFSIDPQKDLVPLTAVGSTPSFIVAHPSAPVNTLRELIDYARKNPGKLTNASSSNGSPGHVGGELFKYMTATEIVHVPYRGGAPAITDLIAGHVDLMFESLQSIAPFARDGKVRALGVSGAARSPAFPELPTIAEAGVPGYLAPTWTGVIAPAGMSRPIVDRLNAAINKALASEAFKEKFAKIGDEPAGGTPEEFAATIKADSAKWEEVVRRSGARLD